MNIDVKSILAQDLQNFLAEAKYEEVKEAIFVKYEAITKEYEAKELELKQIRDFLAKLKKMKEMFFRFEAIAKECGIKEIQLNFIRNLLTETQTDVTGQRHGFSAN